MSSKSGIWLSRRHRVELNGSYKPRLRDAQQRISYTIAAALRNFPGIYLYTMTRGNQRDEARLKNAKDAAGKGVKKDGSYLLRKEADSNALAEKVQ